MKSFSGFVVWATKTYRQLPEIVRKVIAFGTTAATVLYAIAALSPSLHLPAGWGLAISAAAGVVTTIVHKLAVLQTSKAPQRQAGRHGRLPGRIPDGLRHLAEYLTAPLPAPLATFTPAALTYASYGMLGNDRFGDCTIAGAAHLDMAVAVDNKERTPAINAAQAEAIYFQLGDGQDNGLVEADVLAYAQKTGLFGPTSKIDGYAPVDVGNLLELRQVIATFGACYLGVEIPAPADRQFETHQPWALTDTPADQQIEGGHCVTAIGYDADYLYVVTWGAVQRATWRWVAVYLEEAWAVISGETPRVDVASLQADLAAVPA